MATNFVDQLGVQDFIDDLGVTLRIDRNNFFLGLGGVDDTTGTGAGAGIPTRLPRGQVYYPDGWYFVR